MARTPNRSATSGSVLVFTFATTSSPTRRFAISSSSGPTMRHGPHHAAQKSTRTGTGEPSISASNS